MRKIIFSLLIITIFIGLILVGCKKKSSSEPVPIAATNTPTPIVWNTTKNIDDMETIASDGSAGPDNANNIPVTEGGPGYWYTYDDILDVLKPPDGNLNTSNASYVWPMSRNRWTVILNQPTPEPTFIMSSPGYGNTGYCARITGYVTTAFKYGFVGMGVNFLMVNADNSKKPVDISNMTGIRFYAKGDGKNYRIKLPSQFSGFLKKEGDNHYGREFVAPTSWTQIHFLLTQFTQEPYWGTSVNLNDALKEIDSIQFQTVGQPHASIDLSVDNLEIYKQ
ncbi:MAG: CIA30 family protein [Candidatus Goldbacteria bacterium]|nr:CIA30 family protein [Candidatus Goldiibacteriota bacterium]